MEHSGSSYSKDRHDQCEKYAREIVAEKKRPTMKTDAKEKQDLDELFTRAREYCETNSEKKKVEVLVLAKEFKEKYPELERFVERFFTGEETNC